MYEYYEIFKTYQMYNKKKYSKTLYFSGHTTELAKWNITNSASRCLTYTWTKHLCAEYETNLGRIVMHICGGSAEQLFILFITKKQIRLFFFMAQCGVENHDGVRRNTNYVKQ